MKRDSKQQRAAYCTSTSKHRRAGDCDLLLFMARRKRCQSPSSEMMRDGSWMACRLFRMHAVMQVLDTLVLGIS